jgi:hypothetical protein
MSEQDVWADSLLGYVEVCPRCVSMTYLTCLIPQYFIIIGTETWLDKDIRNSEICPRGYVLHRKDRTNKTGQWLIASFCSCLPGGC